MLTKSKNQSNQSLASHLLIHSLTCTHTHTHTSTKQVSNILALDTGICIDEKTLEQGVLDTSVMHGA